MGLVDKHEKEIMLIKEKHQQDIETLKDEQVGSIDYLAHMYCKSGSLLGANSDTIECPKMALKPE